ncbi:PDZ domain-containing protein [Verrucomicrobiaceae bacterium 5K15]|uniref:PDZ domain-containing protein n=1 Tax=Oceaniferula flava TaxID=2800421 RepID=A0AAE2SCH5_9BACT|nr:PDZ domain-containing protein [Oceaniferula flavus]MBK1854394.1 PDZ domain-containing protein [Oceaniferula flavus]MBM1135700.1 PDZ domain-containing protein [Oceaniferula flavus]
MKFFSLLSLTSAAMLCLAHAAADVKNSLVRVNSTLQTWSASQPWDKSAPSSRGALGVLLQGKQVLTTAEMAANSTYIELENADSTRTLPAKVVAIDYESNLALLAPDNGDTEGFFKDLSPIALGEATHIGDKVDIWQLEDNGMPLITQATVQSVDIVSSFVRGHYFLTYEAKASMQSASSSFSLPAVKDGKLLGLLSSYDSKDQIIDIIAPEIIAAFIADAADGEYLGFPSLGIGINSTVDPSFRLWLKLPEDVGGLYVTRVRKGSAADQAGILKGDVLLSIGGKTIGRRGYYDDDNYGRLFWSHLIRGQHKVGDSVKVTVLREGEKKEFTAVLSRPGKNLIPSHTLDQSPNYLVKGGFIFQELSVSYLSAFGKDWQSTAPLNLLDAMASPEDYEKGRNKLVFLSATIPTPATTGYESLRNFIIAKINGQEIADIPSLIKAFETPGSDRLHTIEFADGQPKTIYLDARISDAIDAELLKRGIPALSRG